MRFTKTLVLCSASAAILSAAASPTWAQTAPQTAPVQAQEEPASPEAAAPQQDDAVEDDGEVEGVVVTGIRRSLQSAQSIRRNSDQIVDAIVAEDIGKLPDVTAAESLARVTGVTVERSRGEVGQVLIRGLPDDQATTTYNGRDIFTAEARSVAVQDFPAGGVAALEVYKSSTANLIEPGIAGLINVRSRRPFDFREPQMDGTVRATYANRSEEVDPTWNVMVTDRWDTGAGEIGALVNFSYTRLTYLDTARFASGGIATARPDQVSGATPSGFRFPDSVGLFLAGGERWRPSVNAAFQWRPSTNLEFYSDFLYQGYRRDVSDRLFRVGLNGQLSNVVLESDGRRARSLTAANAGRIFMFHGATDERTETYQFAVGAIYNNGPWRVSTDLATTESRFDLSIYSFDSEVTVEPVVSATFDAGGDYGGAAFNFTNVDLTNPANYRFLGTFDRHLIAEGDDVQFRTDVQYETGIAVIPDIEFGFRYVDRNGAFSNGERFIPSGGIPLSQAPVSLEMANEGFHDDPQRIRSFLSPNRGSIRANINQLRAFGGVSNERPAPDPLSVFNANEKAYTGYAQANYEFEGAVPIDGVIGLRVVKTEVDIAGTALFPNAAGQLVLTPRSLQSEYTDYLPSVTARIRLSDDFQMRLAANMTRTRPSFNDLNPTLIVNPTPDASGRRTGRGGNADLQPIEAANYDVAVEYYFSPTGNATFGLFRREVEGFIQRRVVDITDPVFGPLRIDTPVNVDEATIQGAEGAFTTFLDFGALPEWARSFGVQANFTYVDADESLDRISEWSYNLVGLYEQGPLSARLAYNLRGEYQLFCNRDGGGRVTGCEYVTDIGRLDFSASYSPFEHIRIGFDVSNILGTPYRDFREETGVGVFPRDVRYEETVYSLGVTFRL